jgi:HipA-like C-terminal domain
LTGVPTPTPHRAISANPASAPMFGDQSAIVVDRYDRYPSGAGFGRIHQGDLCQALAVPPTRKYQNEGGPGPNDIAELLRRAMPTRFAEQAVRGFADALIWNWLIAGTDAHAKNYSLLLSRGEARLAPLYDIASALPYGQAAALDSWVLDSACRRVLRAWLNFSAGRRRAGRWP